MKQHDRQIAFATRAPIDFVDLSDEVRAACAASGITEGLVSISTQHTTAGLKINERCERLQEDMRRFLEEAVPAAAYRHDEATVDGRPNGRGHLMALMMGASETVPVREGQPALGDWQSVFFVELDGPRPERRVFVKIVGE